MGMGIRKTVATYVLTIPFRVQKHKTQIPFRLTISFPVKEFVPTWINCSFICAKAKDYRMRGLLSHIRWYLRCILRTTAQFMAIQFKMKWMSDHKAHVSRVWFNLHQNSGKKKKKYERFLMGMPRSVTAYVCWPLVFASRSKSEQTQNAERRS